MEDMRRAVQEALAERDEAFALELTERDLQDLGKLCKALGRQNPQTFAEDFLRSAINHSPAEVQQFMLGQGMEEVEGLEVKRKGKAA
jgi:hypothetical protein